MDARITVAQITGSLPNSELPKVVKLTKPLTDQAIIIHLDGATKLDLSAIGNDNVTFVHVGDRLVILFDNHSTVTIEPFYDSKGLPQADILVELSADRSVSGAEFASLFPITTDQSILPAAGDGGPAAGAHFEAVTFGPLGSPGTPLPLLGPENFNNTGPGGPNEIRTEFVNSLPTLGAPVTSHVDEGGLPTGNHEPGDAGASETGSLHINFGADLVGRSLSFTADQSALSNLHLTSGGVNVTIALTTINGLPALIGFIGNASNLVFEVTLDAGPTDGAYTFTLLKPLDHPVHGQEDSLSLPVGFTATDGTGDSVSGTLTVQVKDDVPTVHVVNASLTENGSVEINLAPAISFGADGSAGPISFGKVTVDATIPISLSGLLVNLDPTHESISLIDQTAFDPLAAGQHATLHIPVTLSDKDGDTVVSEVLVDVVGVNDAPIVTAAIKSGAVTEDANVSVAGNLSAKGTVSFTDVDFIDTHSVSAVAQGNNYLGTFTPTVTTDATGGVTGTVGWTFAVADDATDFLAQDQKLTQTYTIKVDDGHGGLVTQDVVVTITGTNEAPVVAAGGVVTGAVIEDTNVDATTHNLSATGTVNFTDVDLIDTHSVSVTVPPGSNYLGTFTPTLNADSKNGATGNVGWTFTVADDATDFLAQDQKLTQTYTIKIDDGHGGFVTQDVVVTITGTNEAPVIAAGGVVTGAVIEDTNVDATTHNLSATGTVNFTDVDLIDTHSVSVMVPPGSNYLGTFTPTLNADSKNGATGNVGWTFTVADDATDFLAAGQTLTQTYAVKVDDGHGGVATQNVVVTITGTNEAPVIVAAATTATGAVTEDTNPDVANNLNAAGTVSFTDVDFIDTHSVSAVAQGNNYLGTFTPTLNTDSGNGATGNVGWTFTLADDAADFLAAGQTLTQTYAVKVDDHHGGTATQNVTVTINGTNEAPVIVAAATTATGAVTEDTNVDPVTHNLAATGAVAFTDVDFTDTHTVSFVPKDSGYLGTFTPTLNTDSGNGGTGNVGWTFTVADDATDFLAQGQTMTQTYTVKVDDGHGGTATQDVVVTIKGSNEAPVVTADESTGSLTEPTDTPTQDNSVPGAPLTTTGSFAFTDVDITDTHTIIDISPAGRVAHLGELKDVNISADTVNGVGGVVSWTYTIPVAAVESLSAGETLDESFNVTVSDNHGGTTTKTVTVTTLGTNDFPVAHDDVVTSINGSPLTEDSAPISLNATLAALVKANDILDPDHGALNSVTFGSSVTVAANDFGITASDVTFNTGGKGGAPSITLGSKFQTLTDGEFVDVILPYTLKGDQPTDLSTAKVTFHVAGINDPPITDNVTVDAGSVAAGTPIQVKLTGSDVDGTVAKFQINDLPTGGTLFTDAAETQAVHTGDFITASSNAATLFFKPNDGGNTTSFHFTAIDNEGLASTAAGTATVNVNHPPVAVNDTFSVSEDGALVVAAPGVLANDHDPDAGDTIHITSINFSQSFGVDLGSPSGLGDFFFNQDGSFQFLPSQDPNSPAQRLNDGQTATFEFVYQIADSHGATANATVDITIVGHTDVPHAVESQIVDATGFRASADWHFTGQGVSPFTFKVTQGLSFQSIWGNFLPFSGNENPDPATGIDPTTGNFVLGLGYASSTQPPPAGSNPPAVAFADANGPLPPTSGPGSTDHIGYSFTDNSGVTANGQLDLIRIDGSVFQNLTGTAGDDLHFLGAAGATDHLGAGNDEVHTGGRLGTVTTVFGEDGNDTLMAGPGSGQNVFHGGNGNDILVGGVANDILDGGAGDDQIFVGNSSPASGQVNHATLTGGTGNDTFFLNNSDVASFSKITDYHFIPGVEQDTIDLTSLNLVNLGATFNNALFGTPLFDPIANGLNFNDFIKLVDDPNGTDVHLEVDPDGTGNAFQFHDVALLQNHRAADFTDIVIAGQDHIQFHGNIVEITDFGGAGNTTLFSGYSFLPGQTVHETLTGGGGTAGVTIFSFNSTDPNTTATINGFATGGRQDVLDFSHLNLINHGAAFNQALFGTSGFDPTINGKNVTDFVQLVNDPNGKDVHVQVDADGTAATGFHDVAVLHNYQTHNNAVDIMFANAHQAILHVA